MAAKVRMIPIAILYCITVSSLSSFFSSLLVLSAKLIIKSMLLLSMMLLMES